MPAGADPDSSVVDVGDDFFFYLSSLRKAASRLSGVSAIEVRGDIMVVVVEYPGERKPVRKLSEFREAWLSLRWFPRLMVHEKLGARTTEDSFCVCGEYK